MSIEIENGTKFVMYLEMILNGINLNHVSKNATDKIIDTTPDFKIKDLDLDLIFESLIKNYHNEKKKLFLEFFKDITDNYFCDFSITCFRFNINCPDDDLWFNFINDKWDRFPEFLKDYYDYDKQLLIEKTKRDDDDSIAVIFKRMYGFIINELVPVEVESEFDQGHAVSLVKFGVSNLMFMAIPLRNIK